MKGGGSGFGSGRFVLTMMFLYAVENSVTGNVKIGKAAKVSSRLSGLQTGSCAELILRAECEVSESVTEWALHRYCYTEHLRGEWHIQGPLVVRSMDAMRKGTQYVEELLTHGRTLTDEEYIVALERKNVEQDAVLVQCKAIIDFLMEERSTVLSEVIRGDDRLAVLAPWMVSRHIDRVKGLAQRSVPASRPFPEPVEMTETAR